MGKAIPSLTSAPLSAMTDPVGIQMHQGFPACMGTGDGMGDGVGRGVERGENRAGRQEKEECRVSRGDRPKYPLWLSVPCTLLEVPGTSGPTDRVCRGGPVPASQVGGCRGDSGWNVEVAICGTEMDGSGHRDTKAPSLQHTLRFVLFMPVSVGRISLWTC